MIDKVEQLLLEHFRTKPFHNLNFLCKPNPTVSIPGGTCSDKSQEFLGDLLTLGVDAFLHSAFIDGREIHRLVRIIINGQTYFADVGNGWPTLRLLPSFKEIEFECFKIKYRTQITDNKMKVFQQRHDNECLQLEIDMKPRSEEEIHDQIKSRYNSEHHYPFSDSIRFSMIVDNEFLFLRGDHLKRYSHTGFTTTKIDEDKIEETVKQAFGYDINGYADCLRAISERKTNSESKS